MLRNARKTIAARLIALAARIDPAHKEPVDVPAAQPGELAAAREAGSWSVANFGPSPIRAAWPVRQEGILDATALENPQVRALVAEWQRRTLAHLDEMALAPARGLEALERVREEGSC